MNQLIHLFIDLIREHWNWAVIVTCLLFPILIFIFGRKNEPLINSIPGFCTSVGIMATFAVLYLTLSDLPADPDINWVIKELSNKFSASLIGIFFSIIYNFIIKIYKPYQYSKEPWKTVDPQRVLFEMHTLHFDSKEALDNILKQAQGFKNNTQHGIDNVISNLNALSNDIRSIKDDFRENISEISNSLRDNLEENLTKVGKDTHIALQEVILKIHSSFSEEAKKNMEAFQTEMSNSISSIKKTFNELNSSITNLTDKIQSQNEAILSDSQRNSNNMSEGFKAMTSEFSNKFMEQADKMKHLFESLSGTFVQLDKNIASAGDELLQRSFSRLEVGLKKIQEIEARHLTLLENVTNAFGHSVDQYSTISLNHSDILKEMDLQAETMQQLNSSNTKLIEALNNNVILIDTIRHEISELFNILDYFQGMQRTSGKLNGKN